MSFGISFSSFSSHEISKKLYYAILDAEDNNITSIKFDIGNSFSNKIEIGQVLYYNNIEDVRLFKNHWMVIEVDDDMVLKDLDRGGKLLVSGSKWIIIEERPDFVLDVSTTKIDYSKVLELKEQTTELGYVFGGFIISADGNLGKLLDVEVVEVVDDERTNNLLINPHRTHIKKEDVKISMSIESRGLDRYDFVHEFKNNVLLFFNDFVGKYYPIQWTDYKQIQANIDKILLGEYEGEQFLIGSKDDMDESSESEGSQLVGFGDNHHLKMIARSNEKKVKLTQGLVFFDKRTVDIKKEDIDRQMAAIKSKGAEMISLMNLNILEMNNKIREMYRLIDTIEIFTGVSEKIYQIQEGSNSETNTINLFQRKLFMDEEVAVYENGGIDFSNINEFDSWACKNIDRIIPSEIGIVVMQPRRNSKKDYSAGELSIGDIFIKAMEDEANSCIYIIIRNGSNIYRIWSDKIPTHKRLFPLQDEFQGIVNKIMAAENKLVEDSDYYNRVMNEKEKVDGKDELFYYTRNFLLIQGLIYRTKIFPFIPDDFNIMDVTTHGETINYVYDDDNSKLIGNGFPSFNDFVKNINKGMKRGKKVILFQTNYNYDGGSDTGRYNLFFNGRKPSTPSQGVYTIKSDKIKTERRRKHTITEKEYLENPKIWTRPWRRSQDDEFVEEGIKYLRVEKTDCPPEDITYEERIEFYITFFQDEKYEMFYNQWIKYVIYPDDNFLVCYEDIDDEILDFYLTDREARRNYLTVMPLFQRFKEEKAKDAEIEKYYVDMILSQIRDINVPEKDKLDIIKQAIEFWKFGGKTFVNTFSTIKKDSVDEIKSVKIILDETKRILKKNLKVDIVLNTNVRNKIQHISTRRYDFYVKGLSKKEFVDKVASWTSDTKKKLGATCNVLIDENKIREIDPQLLEGSVLQLSK